MSRIKSIIRTAVTIIILFTSYCVTNSQTSISSIVDSINRTGDIYTQKILIEKDTTYILSRYNEHYEFMNIELAIVAILPNNVVVEDFKIFNDTVYFCGNFGSYGYVAQASISDLFYNNDFYLDTICLSQSLNKIQVYLDDSSRTNIACIGVNSSGESLLFHSKGYSPRNYKIYKSQSASEIFDDLILKGDYIVTVGRIDNLYRSEFLLRKYSKNDISQSFEKKLDNGINWKFVNNLIADTVYGDKIAVVGEATDTDNNDLITVAMIIDIRNWTGDTYAYGSTKHMDTYGENKHIRDILYNNIDYKLLILEEYPKTFSTLNSSVIPLDINPNGANSFANIIYSYINGIDHKFNSIAEKSPYVFYNVGINPSTTYQVEIWKGDRSQNGGNCNTLSKIDVFMGDINGIDDVSLILIHSDTINWIIKSTENLEIEIYNICQ